MESIHVNFDELPQMASDQISSVPAPECQTMALEHASLSPVIQRQAKVPQAGRTVTTSNELDLLFSLMFDELLNGSSKVVSKSSTVASDDFCDALSVLYLASAHLRSIGIDIPVRVIIYHRYRTYIMSRVGCCGLEHPQGRELKDKLSAHQETISILSKQKEAQIKLYKTREDKELDKVIELENKVKFFDNIVYKTGQSVQMMNMLNNKCRTSFAKPEFLKKAQRANPRLYDIGCYNDNLALMLTPDSDEVIRLEKESRSKLSDLIMPFDYDKMN
nr:hypothetical protein [Tanacetum cinerariifolium]